MGGKSGRVAANREYKDTVFTRLFRDKAKLAERLYHILWYNLAHLFARICFDYVYRIFRHKIAALFYLVFKRIYGAM